MPLHFIKKQDVYDNSEVCIQSNINPSLLNDPPHLKMVSSDKPFVLTLEISPIANQSIKDVCEVIYQYLHTHSYETITLPIIEIPGESYESCFIEELRIVKEWVKKEEWAITLILPNTLPSFYQTLITTVQAHLFKKLPVFNKCVCETNLSSLFRPSRDDFKPQEPSFTTLLFRLIDDKGYTEVDVYKRANIDRKHFSKIRSNLDYHPKKVTIIAFAIALKLNISETNALLKTAGYTLSRSQTFDIIIEYFISRKEYDIDTINIVLNECQEELIGF